MGKALLTDGDVQDHDVVGDERGDEGPTKANGRGRGGFDCMEWAAS